MRRTNGELQQQHPQISQMTQIQLPRCLRCGAWLAGLVGPVFTTQADFSLRSK
jgi:hypothetical protein